MIWKSDDDLSNEIDGAPLQIEVAQFRKENRREWGKPFAPIFLWGLLTVKHKILKTNVARRVATIRANISRSSRTEETVKEE